MDPDILAGGRTQLMVSVEKYLKYATVIALVEKNEIFKWPSYVQNKISKFE